jgi:hypothetical protein
MVHVGRWIAARLAATARLVAARPRVVARLACTLALACACATSLAIGPAAALAGPAALATPATGPGAPIDFAIFPADNPWNADVSAMPVDARSATYLKSIGLDTGLHPDFGTVWDGAPIGIPYVVVRGTQPKVPVTFYYADESDPGPYPIPPDAPIEGGSASSGDRHVLTLDADNQVLYELYDAHFNADLGRWEAGSGAIWDLKQNSYRPAGWTSADAAGLPILPGLVRYDEVARGEITHALRFTVPRTQRAYVFPASHFASDSTDPALPPMGLRVRLKASYDISRFPAEDQVILRALKKYGMIVADNGSPWYISGAPDSRWNDDALHSLGLVEGKDFEVISTSGVPGTLPAPIPKLALGKTVAMRARTTMSRWCRFSDPGGHAWSATVNYGDGSGTKRLTLARGGRFHLLHRYAKAGTYRITVKIRNAEGGTGTAKLKVVVKRR